jgi:hypothetical protein
VQRKESESIVAAAISRSKTVALSLSLSRALLCSVFLSSPSPFLSYASLKAASLQLSCQWIESKNNKALRGPP